MAVYEQRLARDLERIRGKIADAGIRVEEALNKSVQSLLTDDRNLANNVILGDYEINRGFTEIDRLCHSFLALHLPSAGHLRQISTILRLNSELERIGDYAATISREGLQIPKKTSRDFKAPLEKTAGESQNLLRRAIKAFHDSDAEAARETMALSARVLTEYDKMFGDLADAAAKNPAKARDLLFLSVIYSKLDRIRARAENICEETLFAVTGEPLERRKFNVLFLDERNNGQSRLAEAVGKKMAGNRCTFSSAGRNAAAELHPGLPEFLSAHGLDAGDAPPRAFDPAAEEADHYDIVISLDGPVTSYFSAQPFRTVLLEWDVGQLPESLDKAETVNRYHDIYRELTVQVRNLTETLHGPEA